MVRANLGTEARSSKTVAPLRINGDENASSFGYLSLEIDTSHAYATIAARQLYPVQTLRSPGPRGGDDPFARRSL